MLRNEFTAVIEKSNGDWFIAYCPEITPEPMGREEPRTHRESLAEAISLILEDRREDGLLRGVPEDALSTKVHK